MGEMLVMDRTGDRNVFQWGDDPRDIERARAIFNQYREDGYDLWRLGKRGQRGEKITEFDPSAQHGILATPRLVGG